MTDLMTWTIPSIADPIAVPELLIGPAQFDPDDAGPPWRALVAPPVGADAADRPVIDAPTVSNDAAVLTAFGMGTTIDGDDHTVSVLVIGDDTAQTLARAEVQPWPTLPADVVWASPRAVQTLSPGQFFAAGTVPYQVQQQTNGMATVQNLLTGAVSVLPSSYVVAPLVERSNADPAEPVGAVTPEEEPTKVAAMATGAMFVTDASYYRKDDAGVIDLLTGTRFAADGRPEGADPDDLSVPLAPEQGLVVTADASAEAVGAEEVAAAWATVLPLGDRQLLDLALHPGDLVVPREGVGAGQLHAVLGFGPLADSAWRWVLLRRLADGSTRLKHPQSGAAAASPRALLWPQSALSGSLPPSLYVVPLPASSLEPGQAFALGPASTTALTADEVSDDAIVFRGDDGTAHTLRPDEVVYVMDDETPKPTAAAPSPIDLSRWPVVGSWDDFADETPPELAETSGDLLTPFEDREDEHGVYAPLAALPIGQRFADRAGADCQLVAHGAVAAAYRPLTGDGQHETPTEALVKVIAAAPRPPAHLEPLFRDLVDRYESVGGVPSADVESLAAMVNAAGLERHPTLAQLPFGTRGYDAAGRRWTVVACCGSRVLVCDVDGRLGLAAAAARIERER